MTRLLFFVAVFTFAFSAFALPKDSVSEYYRYQSKEFSFSMLCPKKWEVTENINDVVPFIMESQQETPQDNFRENVNAVIETSIGYTTNQFVDLMVSKLQNRLANFKLQARGMSEDNPLHPVWIIYDNAKGAMPLKFLSYFYKVNGNIVIVTGSAKIDVFEKYLPTFDVVCNSYQITPVEVVPVKNGKKK